MTEKYLSIITNFGCHYTCPYCNSRVNDIRVPAPDVSTLEKLLQDIKDNNITIVSVSGGGDPLHNYDNNFNQQFYYGALFGVLSRARVPLEMHTSYLDTNFPYYMCKRVVYHLNRIKQLKDIKRNGYEIVRVVFVATEDLTQDEILYIAGFCTSSPDIDELSFRQMIGPNYELRYYNDDLLRGGHKKLWWYITQNDYNLYWVNSKIYTKFSDIGKEI